MLGHDFAFAALGGGKLALEAWRGQPVLIVNTASYCGFTPQYDDLEALWRRYRDKGLVVLGVPSNDFGAQEPGSAAEIQEFCTSRYAVDFPLAGKEKVIGAEAHPFFRWVAETIGEDAAPRWNFHKYLIDRNGALAGAWPSRVRPTDKAVVEAVEAALGS
jgi:glutathione peroxidase